MVVNVTAFGAGDKINAVNEILLPVCEFGCVGGAQRTQAKFPLNSFKVEETKHKKPPGALHCSLR